MPNFLLPKPKIPGADIAGVVVDPGNSVKLRAGDRVSAMLPLLGTRWGGLADFAAVDEALVAKVPPSVDLVSAASLPLVGLTVSQAFASAGFHEPASCVSAMPLAGKRVLVHAGSGGVGTFAIQYAKNVLGASWVTTTASPRREVLLRSLGADEVIDYRPESLIAPVEAGSKASLAHGEALLDEALSARLSRAGPFDIVLDPMSWKYETPSLAALGPSSSGGGRGADWSEVAYLNILSSDWALTAGGMERSNGLLTWAQPLLASAQRLVLGPASGPLYKLVTVNPNGPGLERILRLVEKGTLRAVVDEGAKQKSDGVGVSLEKAEGGGSVGTSPIFTMEAIAEAYRHLEKGHTAGKIVVAVNSG